MKRLWKFHWDCGRMGDLEGLFVATEAEVNAQIGKHLNFGEALGKHSEVSGPLESRDLEPLDVPSESVEQISLMLGRTWSGYNPLLYTKDAEDEYEDEDE